MRYIVDLYYLVDFASKWLAKYLWKNNLLESFGILQVVKEELDSRAIKYKEKTKSMYYIQGLI